MEGKKTTANVIESDPFVVDSLDERCTNKLDIIENILKQLKLDMNRNKFLTILEKLLDIQDDKSDKKKLKLQIVDLLLKYLETGDNGKLETLTKQFGRIFSHQELKKLTVDRSCIKSGSRKLGHGDFGIVTLGRLYKSDRSWVQVAVKRVTKNSSDFITEAKLMTQFDHKNVIKILAFQKTPVMIVMEYMDWGNLYSALKKHDFNDVDLLNVFLDIASGMEYISEKNYVHRDLWGNNILTNSKKQCKVGDFGFCKYVGDTNGYTDGKDLPPMICLIAPEVDKWKIYSMKSDVWSMGLIMWETYIHAEKRCDRHRAMQIAYGELQLAQYALTGMGIEKFPKPLHCPSMVHIYLTKRILNVVPERRHTFSSIKKKMADFLTLTKSALLNDLD